MNNFENDIPKHKKKKQSSTSKSKDKSNHKHEYADCVFIMADYGWPHVGTYCKLCGKIGDMKIETVSDFRGMRRMMTAKEMLEKYKDLEQFQIKDILQKYVQIEVE